MKMNSVEMMAKTAKNQHTAREMRRGKRFEVSQSAVITQPGHSGIICEIRDFCLGGLFLKFTDPEAAIASLTNRPNAAVEILFTSDLLEAAQIFRVRATLRRISQLGVGVAFD